MNLHSKKMCAAIAWLFLVVCATIPCSAVPIPEGTHQEAVDLGGITLEVFTYRPKYCTPSAMLLVFHGLHRGVEDNLDDLHKISNELCLLEVVPLFDEPRFPGWRYQKGGIVHHGSVLPANQWTGNLVLRLADWVRQVEQRPDLTYLAIGHSAGGQFLRRFAAYIPNHALRIIIANPSSHVWPSVDVEAPFGFKGVFAPDQAESALRNYLAQPVTMVLGKSDTGDKDRDDEPAAAEQGKNRYQRGMNAFHAAQAEAGRRGWPFNWQLIELPGVGHSTQEVFTSKAVKQVLREAVALPTSGGDGSPHSENIGSETEGELSFVAQRLTSREGFPWHPLLFDDFTAQGQDQTRNPEDKSTPQNQQPGADAGTPQNSSQKPDVKITPRQAEELFHSVDEILAFDSKHSGLPIKKEVKRRLTSRDEVVAYLTKHMKDEDVKRLQRSELVLKKFGLLPPDYDLEKLMVQLLREQIAGYYDPKTKTVNLLDWVPMEEQAGVMAHELTHALQDQSINLDKFMKKGDKDLGEMKKDPTPQDIENDEIDDAREAVVEGQAEAVMLDYELAPLGRSIADSADLVESMESQMANGGDDSSVFKDAPIFLRESLTFPYSYGLKFVIKLMQTGGKERAFEQTLEDPPHTTRQIMQPETYISGESIAPMAVPDFKKDFKDYLKFDIGAMGEFDVAVLVEQYAGKKASERLYPEWRGGYYYAAKSKDDSLAPLGLLYVSRWSNAEKAAEFAAIYAESLNQRYKQVKENADAAGQAEEPSTRKHPILLGRHQWSTEEGPVVIEERGDTVFVSESLDPATTGVVEKEVFGQ